MKSQKTSFFGNLKTAFSSKILLASILAAASVSAQMTGDWGRAMSTGGMMGGTTFGSILFTVFWIGLVLLVWLWVFKLWKEVRKK